MKKLSISGELNESTFAAMEINALAELTFSLVEGLQNCKKLMKAARTKRNIKNDPFTRWVIKFGRA